MVGVPVNICESPATIPYPHFEHFFILINLSLHEKQWGQLKQRTKVLLRWLMVVSG
jgi:hypothetical protein